MKQEMEAAVVFAILMQDIQDKSPGYMLEKWKAVQAYDRPRNLLDASNMTTLRKWIKFWNVKDE